MSQIRTLVRTEIEDITGNVLVAERRLSSRVGDNPSLYHHEASQEAHVAVDTVLGQVAAFWGSRLTPKPDPNEGKPNSLHECARGTVIVLGHPSNKILAILGEGGWRNVDTGEVYDENFVRAGWNHYNPYA